jgi:uncharacterized FAD-dependent dehydrogenase
MGSKGHKGKFVDYYGARLYNGKLDSMTKKFDVIIVGGGPGGLFAALELSKASHLNILLIEKGKDIDDRSNIVCGLGGAGAFSDGKLTLSSQTGGRLKDYLGENETDALIKYVDDIYVQFGAPDKVYGLGHEINEIARQASTAGLHLIAVPVRHMGTECSRSVLRGMRDRLSSSIEIRLEVTASRIIVDGSRVTGIETDTGERLNCHYLILAPGREGSDWMFTQAKQLNLATLNNPVDIGVRVELPVCVMEKLTNVLYEAKLEYLSRSFTDRIRTFCMCPAGEVVVETTGGDDSIITVNGQSYADKKTDNTNFALLVTTDFTEPFHEPIAYAKYIARLANILSGGVLVQRFGDLLAGHRSTPSRIRKGLVTPTLTSATPGDISFALPYRHLTGIVEMLQAMNELAPGVASPDTLLYGVEIKLYSHRLKLSSSLEAEVKNMFSIGDGAGVSRGIIQASASGVVAAREIVKRICY